MSRVLLVTLSAVLAIPLTVDTFASTTAHLGATQAGAQPAAGSREALQPRNAEERAIADAMAKWGVGGTPIQPGQIVGAGPRELGPEPKVRGTNVGELRDAACKTDLIVTGEVVASRVFFTKEEKYLVTLHDFQVDSALRMPLSPGTTIRVAVAGGETVLDSKKTIAIQDTPIPTDQAAIVWLKKLAGTDVYEIAPDVGVLTFKDGKPKSALPTRLEILQDPDSLGNFWTLLSNSASTCGRK